MWILQNNIQINLENFWLDRLWHFKLSTVAVTQTGHFSLSHTALLVLLEHQSYGLFPLSMKKKINGGFLSNFPWQYFVSCGVFVSWVVTNKAYLIETSIHYLKVLVIKGGGVVTSVAFYWKFHSLPSATVWLQLCEMKYDLMFLMHFQSSRFVSMAVREGAVGFCLGEWLKLTECTHWLPEWDRSSPSQAPGSYISWHLSLLPKRASWEIAARTGPPLQTS